MGRTVADTCQLMAVQAGQHAIDPLSYDIDATSLSVPKPVDLGRLKVAWTEDFGTSPVDKPIRKVFRDRVKAMRHLFLRCDRIEPDLGKIDECFDVVRAIAFVGRSMEANASLATRTGHLRVPGPMLVSSREAEKLPPERVCFMVTGSQGEPGSALARIALLQMKGLEPSAGDAVIFSSRAIPGNDRAIGAVINQLLRLGAEVYDTHVAEVHVSGHASQEELKLVLNLVTPHHFVPVHGEYRHLVRHNLLAAEVGVPAERCHLLEDGDVLELDGTAARRGERVTAGRVFVDGKGVGDVEDVVLRDRRHLSEDGLVLAVLAIAQQSGDLVAGPDLVSRGVVGEEASPEVLEAARAVVLEALAGINPESRTDPLEVKEEVRRALRRYFKRFDRRPVILPFVMEM